MDKALSDGKWVVVHKMKIDDSWAKVTGQEEVIVGDLSELKEDFGCLYRGAYAEDIAIRKRQDKLQPPIET